MGYNLLLIRSNQISRNCPRAFRLDLEIFALTNDKMVDGNEWQWMWNEWDFNIDHYYCVFNQLRAFAHFISFVYRVSFQEFSFHFVFFLIHLVQWIAYCGETLKCWWSLEWFNDSILSLEVHHGLFQVIMTLPKINCMIKNNCVKKFKILSNEFWWPTIFCSDNL